MIDLAILWHLHQPVYRDPRTGEFILPWVRLHASRAYYDMAKALEPHEGVHVHLNVVPGLLDQIEAYANGSARDRFLELTEKPAADLELSERATIWSRFFMVDWETEVHRIPRYQELLVRRGADLASIDVQRLARESSTEELRDLQVLFNLAWTGFALRDDEPGLQALLKKGRGFAEEDKRVVLNAQRRAAQAIIPLYRALEERGQVELTATPHYHPILPLLIDSESAHEGLPGTPLPTTPFRHPEDAREQIARALVSHERRFGKRPLGMWPAEGSVSTAAATLFAEAGVRWIASDEGVLLRSQEQPDRSAIHAPHRLETTAGPIDLVFRDRGLSDAIGFVYSKQPAEAAVNDLLGHLKAIGEANEGKGEPPLVSIILDGENPWEHYQGSGREFLSRLYGALAAKDGPARTVRLSEALPRRKPRPLSRLHAGSWIDANFRIWIGHSEDVRGWEGLGKVRRALATAEAAGSPKERLTQAREALLIAEGSDWFWWYGDDFSTDNAAEFDALFRGYLQLACDALGIPYPPEIAEPISAQARAQGLRRTDELRLPRCLIAPTVDGRETRFGEWNGAGRLKAGKARGAMAQGTLSFSQLWFGFDQANLYLRLDPVDQAALPEGLNVDFELTGSFGKHRLSAGFPQISAAPLEREGGARLGTACGVDILEAAVPLEALGVKAGDRLELSVAIRKGSVELQRLPPSGVLAMVAPDAAFDRLHWKV